MNRFAFLFMLVLLLACVHTHSPGTMVSEATPRPSTESPMVSSPPPASPQPDAVFAGEAEPTPLMVEAGSAGAQDNPVGPTEPVPVGQTGTPPPGGDAQGPASGDQREPALLQPINLDKALAEIRRSFQPPEYPVLRNGQLFYLTHDLDADGIPEILVPGVEAEAADFADFEYISDFSRLYDTDREDVRFRLYVFGLAGGVCSLTQKQDLGFHRVFKSFIKFYGNTVAKNPVIIAATFQTREGTIHKWTLFKSPSCKPVSTLELAETFLKKVILEDIDDNGFLDVIVQEKSIEERMGYETYLSWLKWNGRAFVEYRNTNIVRNLNYFLQHVKELLIAGKTEELLAYAIEPQILQQWQRETGSAERILADFFGLPAEGGLSEESASLGEIEEVVLPDILDNPFYLKDERGYYFPLVYRIVYQGDISLLSETFLYMLKNPFGTRQFTFIPRENG